MDSGVPEIDRAGARNSLWRGFLRLLHIALKTVRLLCKTQHNVGDVYRPLETGSRTVHAERCIMRLGHTDSWTESLRAADLIDTFRELHTRRVLDARRA